MSPRDSGCADAGYAHARDLPRPMRRGPRPRPRRGGSRAVRSRRRRDRDLPRHVRTARRWEAGSPSGAAEHPGRVELLVLGCSSPGARHGVESSPAVNRTLTQPDAAAARLALPVLMYTPEWLATHLGP